MDNQNYIYCLPFIAILVLWIFFLKRLRQYGKAQAAKANKTEQYERRTAYLYAIIFILVSLQISQRKPLTSSEGMNLARRGATRSAVDSSPLG